MKNILLLAFTLGLFSCHRNDNSSLKGIIGEDNSVQLKEGPAFAEIVSRHDKLGKAAYCNAVRTEKGQVLTANHCLGELDKNILLSWKRVANSFQRFPEQDLAVGKLIGGAAPSTLIVTYKGEVSQSVALESQWFDIKTGKWRRSRGTGLVHGRVVEHDLDMNPGASGSGLYITDENGEKKLVAIHLGFDSKKNKNIAILLPEVKSTTNESLRLSSYQYEVQQRETCYFRYDEATDEVVIDHCTFNPGGTPPAQDPGDDDSDGDTGGVIIIPGGPGGPGTPGEGGQRDPGDVKDCFNCDKVSEELKRKDVFDKDCDNPDAGPSVGPMLAEIPDEGGIGGKEEGSLPEFSYNPKEGEFTDSLKEFAQKMIEATKWLTSPTLSEKVGQLSQETVAKLKEWTDKVIRNLDDYYALLTETIKSDQVQPPTLPEVDVTKEGIESAQKYLDAVKQQIRNRGYIF